MQTDYMEQSNLFDRAASECNSLVLHLKSKRVREEETARKNGEPPMTDFYDLVINEIKGVASKMESIAAEYWEMYKRYDSEPHNDGVFHLLSALVKSWAEDYETALCRKDTEKIKYLRKEAENLVRDTTIHRIEKSHKQFVNEAHKKWREIVEDTKNAHLHTTEHGTTNHSGEHMRNRCPLCGGGMYAKKLGINTVIIKCSGCALTEVVEVSH